MKAPIRLQIQREDSPTDQSGLPSFEVYRYSDKTLIGSFESSQFIYNGYGLTTPFSSWEFDTSLHYFKLIAPEVRIRLLSIRVHFYHYGDTKYKGIHFSIKTTKFQKKNENHEFFDSCSFEEQASWTTNSGRFKNGLFYIFFIKTLDLNRSQMLR